MEIYELKRSYGNLLETADLEALPYLWMQIFIYEMLARVSRKKNSVPILGNDF